MGTSKHINFVERLGRWAGRCWRSYVRCERHAMGWLVTQGFPKRGASALIWLVNLIVLGVLLYAAFWLALLVLFAVAAAWTARNTDWYEEEKQPEWREGYEGYGLYDKGGWRIDQGDPDER